MLFLGTGAYGVDSLRFPNHPRIRVERLPFQQAGWRQKLHYLRYCLGVLGRILLWRPQWVYASELFAAPVAWIAGHMPGVRVIFHEHDSPPSDPPGALRVLGWARRWLFRNVLCIWPNRRRAEIVAPECRDKFIVWNCPSRGEVAPARRTRETDGLRVFYHGSISPVLAPLAAVQALASVPEGVSLTVVGYETVGTAGYRGVLRAEAARLGVAHRLHLFDAMPRAESLQLCRDCDVGLCFMPIAGGDINLSHIVGASNKAFDYLACGLPILVSDRPDWRETFVDAGLAMVCDPEDPASIATAWRWFLEHPAEMRAMGERGRQRILDDWNYEAQFRPVMERIEGHAA